MNDIPSFTRAKAETEVDKFLLDAEMINVYINFGKKLEEDPDFKVPDSAEEDSGLFSFRNIIALYIGYVALTSTPQYFRRWVASQEAAGTWHGTNIPLIDEWIRNTTPVKVEAAVQAASDVADAVSRLQP